MATGNDPSNIAQALNSLAGVLSPLLQGVQSSPSIQAPPPVSTPLQPSAIQTPPPVSTLQPSAGSELATRLPTSTTSDQLRYAYLIGAVTIISISVTLTPFPPLYT